MILLGKAVYNQEIKDVLDSFLLDNPIVVPGKMFGYPAYYVSKKLFACVYEDGVGLKVPSDTAERLLREEGIIPFTPMGRKKMREWVQINRKSPQDYLLDREIFHKSIEFVKTL